MLNNSCSLNNSSSFIKSRNTLKIFVRIAFNPFRLLYFAQSVYGDMRPDYWSWVTGWGKLKIDSLGIL